ncbi:hypothetical protein AB0K02_27290 [Streptomyces sp. NPDC049597]
MGERVRRKLKRLGTEYRRCRHRDEFDDAFPDEAPPTSRHQGADAA